MDKNNYVPMNQLIHDKETSWSFTQLNISYEDIARQGIVLWCTENIEGRWTMLGGCKFGFEDEGDAVTFKIQFGFSS